MKKVLMAVCVVAIIGGCLVGCKGSDHPTSDHPKSDHPTSDHPG